MSEIEVIRNPTEKELRKIRVKAWPIWTKEESEFPWYYDQKETCLFLEGDAVITPKKGRPVEMGAGDLVIFPEGLSCIWKVRKAVKKLYNLG